MDWKAAIDKFEERRLAIWENMPHDVYDLSNGVVPGDTNVYGQYVMTALYADSEMRTLCDEILFYMVETAKEGNVDLLNMYIEALDSVENLEQLIKLTEAALMYFNRHHMWVDLVIPWGVFNGFAKQDFSKYL